MKTAPMSLSGDVEVCIYEQTSGSGWTSMRRCDSSRNAAWQTRMGVAMLLSVARPELLQFFIFALFYLLGNFVKEYNVRIITCLLL